MLEKVRPDIVCVATRQTYHAEHIEAAVKAGVKGIVCDKPLCTTLDEADRILAALRQADVPLAFGLELRWSKQYQTLIQMLKNGAIGDVAPY
jgi:predicted dehydrogenase